MGVVLPFMIFTHRNRVKGIDAFYIRDTIKTFVGVLKSNLCTGPYKAYLLFKKFVGHLLHITT